MKKERENLRIAGVPLSSEIPEDQGRYTSGET